MGDCKRAGGLRWLEVDMTILSAQSILSRVLATRCNPRNPLTPGLDIVPFYERLVEHGMSYGLSAAGYDVRIKDALLLPPGGFALATTVEFVQLPGDLMGQLVDKSSWARRGIAVQNTVFEPGWFGYPTIELSNHNVAGSGRQVRIPAGAPIAQLVFHVLDRPTDRPYSGKYQDQPQRPVEAIDEGGEAS